MTIETIKEILGWLDQHSWYIISIFIPIGLFCIFYSSKQIEKANKELIENLKKLLNDEEFNFLIDDKNRTKYLRKFNDIIKTEMSITEDKYIAMRPLKYKAYLKDYNKIVDVESTRTGSY
ncbi:hypothetical protein G5B97_00590 [Campylobacter concisus]|uniref:hypothetical protein n=1 Tax=Campylobacter concisus TaxID=199 RepID=UPI0018A90778|nr:hypothetical protein [Campylobacter concisus]QPI00462.1 hypothetical protein G5B97_00590 [Campylobacter concisus]